MKTTWTAFSVSVFFIAQFFCTQAIAQTWWNPHWHFRVPITVGAAGFERSDKPIEVPINFSLLFTASGGLRTLDTNSIRVVEVSASGTILDTLVVFQFDKDSTYNAATNARGTLVFLLKETTPANATRNFDIYFDAVGSVFTLPSFTPLISVTDTASYQGQSTFKITTPLATYFYHKLGGGFASMIDSTGRDWISYRPGGGSAGEYRGIPNLGTCAHAGYTNSTSSLLSRGPLKSTILSRTTDDAWLWQWDFFPTFARMTLHRRGGTYWILYEGTPGGQLDVPGDFSVRSPGVRQSVAQSWTGDIPSPEWIYFGDAALRRVLYLAHHEDDLLNDQFYQMENNMTVFGFGRQSPCCDRYLTAIPMHLTIGFAEDSSTASITINAAFRDMNVLLGQPATTGIHADDNSVPSTFALEQNYPNPFNPSTKIRFQLPQSELVTLRVFDVLGREVRSLVNERLGAGEYEVPLEANELSSGVYYYRMDAGNFRSTKKLLVVK